MNLISDTGDLMSFDWVFGDIQVKKRAILLAEVSNKSSWLYNDR